MRKVSLLLLIMMLLTTSCSREPIKIGFSANLTGTGSELATAAMYGIGMVIDEVNESGGINGRQVELILSDDGNTVESALASDKYLADQGVSLIIGHMLSALGELTVPYTNETQMPMISPTISSSIYADSDDYFYTLYPYSDKQSDKIAQVIRDHGITNIAIIYDNKNRAFSYAVAERTRSQFLSLGGRVDFIEPFESEEDLDALTYRIIKENPSGLVVVATGFDLAKMVQFFSRESYEVPIYTSTWSMSNDLLNGGGPAAEGIFAVSAFDAESTDPEYQLFSETYRERYGETPTFASMLGYDAAIAAVEALKKADSTKGEDIKDALDKIGDLKGIQQNFTFDLEGDVERPILLFSVENGRFMVDED